MPDGFDPTYKGWKPLSLSTPDITGLTALILPTRDGNIFTGILLAYQDHGALILPTRDGNLSLSVA